MTEIKLETLLLYDDVINAFIEMLDKKIKNEIFNVGSGQTYSVNTLIKLLGKNKVVNIPKRPGEPDCTFADISKILKKTKWRPKISFEDGVKKLMESINDFKDAPLWDSESIKMKQKIGLNIYHKLKFKGNGNKKYF